MYNHIKASYSFKCHESVTYATHGTMDFLKHLVPLVQRWRGPVSMTVYAPGSDFQRAIKAIYFYR